MKTIQSNIKKAKKYLDNDDCIAVPTETVYGLAGNAYSNKAVKKIFKLKKRPSNNPLIVHYYNINKLEKDCNINENFKIRFVLPSLSFQESEMEYTYLNPSNLQPTVYIKSLRPVYLDFPVLLKFRTNRINNYAVYGIVGLRYGIDMSSNIDVNNSIDLEDQVIKLNKHDFGSEIGGGVDLFLEYFKLGIELKLGSGMRNMLYNTPGEDPTKFDNAIESLRSRVWTLSFTFEG